MDNGRMHEIRQKLVAGQPVRFPASDPAEERTVPAGWLIEAVRSGVEVQLENARIEGRLDLQNVHVQKDFRVEHTQFLEFADFGYSEFQRSLKLTGSVFGRAVSFDSVRFQSDVWLDDTTL